MKEYIELMHDYFAGELTDEQHRRLEAWLEESPDHVDQFVREAFINRQINDAMISRKALGTPLPGMSFLEDDNSTCVFDDDSLDASSNSSTFFSWGSMLPKLGVVLCVLLLVGVFLFTRHGNVDDPSRSSAGPINQIAESSIEKVPELPLDEDIACEIVRDSAVASVEPLEPSLWQEGEKSCRVTDRRVEAGQTLDLIRGKVRVSFDCGAVLTLTGPAALQVDSSMNATLLHGDVLAVVSQEAIGFLLHTKEMDVRDLGTEFSVSVVPGGNTKVEVLDGEVEANLVMQPGRDKEIVNLVQGQYLRTDNDPSDVLDQLMVFRGTRIGFNTPDCLERFAILDPDPAHFSLDEKAGMLCLDTTWGSVFARRGRGNNLFLLPISSSADFDVVLSVAEFGSDVACDHVGLIYLADEDHYSRIIYGKHIVNENLRYYIKFNTETAGAPFRIFEKTSDPVHGPFKLRLARRGDEISGWWSTDGGETWILRGKGKATENARYIGFYASQGHSLPSRSDTTRYGKVRIDSLEIECGE